VTVHLSRVLDASAQIALFAGHPRLDELLGWAEHGRVSLLLPAACIAEAERVVQAGTGGWESVLLTPGIRTLPLVEHAAIEVGRWPGTLGARHAVHEAYALRSVVVTTDRAAYDGLLVALQVV
jgi:hypothetical protein